MVDGISSQTFSQSFLKTGSADFAGSLHALAGALGVTESIFKKGSHVGLGVS